MKNEHIPFRTRFCNVAGHEFDIYGKFPTQGRFVYVYRDIDDDIQSVECEVIDGRIVQVYGGWPINTRSLSEKMVCCIQLKKDKA